MDIIYAVPLAALMISVGTLVLSAFGLRQKAGLDYTSILEKRLSEAEADLKTCRSEAAQLKEEQFRLMQRVLQLEARGPNA